MRGLLHTFLNHSNGQTLLKSAELTPIPSPFVDGTVFIAETHIFSAFLNRPFEESLTS